MKRYIIVTVLLLLVYVTGKAQTESVYLHTDKTVCYPGDTLWFRGYVFENDRVSTLSTNLYVELYNDDGSLISRKQFPIAIGASFGQLTVPAKIGLYWIRSYTRNSGFAFQSMTVRGDGDQVVTRTMAANQGIQQVTDTTGLAITSVYTAKGIVVSIIPDAKSPYYEKPFKLLIKNYQDSIASHSFVLQQGHQLQMTIPVKNIRGYLSLLFFTGNKLFTRQDLLIPQEKIPITLSQDNGRYTVKINDSIPCNYSLAVVNAREPGSDPGITHCLLPAAQPMPTDVNGLTFSGKVDLQERNNHLVKAPNMIIMLQTDSVNSKTRLLSLDSTRRFYLSGVAFQDTAWMYYSVNARQSTGEKVKDFHVKLDPQVFPPYHAPDSADFKMDTVQIAKVETLPGLEKGIVLKTVEIKGRRSWADRNKALDSRYATGRFSWPARFSFNLMDTTQYDPKYVYNIFEYLQRELPSFVYDITGQNPPTFKGKPVTFYLDEDLINYNDLSAQPPMNLAYVKVIEDMVDDDANTRSVSGIAANVAPSMSLSDNKINFSGGTDNTPSAMICIYRRKDKDIRGIPSDHIKTIALKGYDKTLNWTTPDRTTLLWSPYIHTKSYSFSLPKEAAPGSYKVILEGENAYGEAFRFEQVIK